MATPEFRFRVQERTDAHTTFTVFVGQPGQGGNAGTLTFTNEEYDQLAPVFLAAPDMLERLKAAKVDLEDFADPEGEYDFTRQAARRMVAELNTAIEAATAQ